MAETQFNHFSEVLQESTREKFVKILLENSQLDFKSLYSEYLEISETTARHHLKQLLSHEIILKVKVKGSKAIHLRIHPKYLEKARKYFNVDRKFAYFGLVGESGGQQLQHFIDVLSHNNWYFEKLVVFSKKDTLKVMSSEKVWNSMTKKYKGSELIEVPHLDYGKTLESMRNMIERVLPQYSIVVDVTGFTKLHTLALYSLANEYDLIRMYIPKNESRNILMLP